MEKDQIQTLGDVLSGYHDPRMVNLIMRDRATRAVEGVVHDAAVLFVDIRRFNDVCEKVDPQVVAAILNEVQSYVMELIHRYDGVVDKLMGDCTMAYWINEEEEPEEDTPLDRLKKGVYDRRAEKCIRGALRAAHAIVRGAGKLEKKLVELCGYTVEFGIGIHYGPVYVGNIGTVVRKDYTVVGNTVNIAAKLTNMAPAGQVYLTETAMARITGEFSFITVMNEGDDEWKTIFTRGGVQGIYALVQKAKRVDAADAVRAAEE